MDDEELGQALGYVQWAEEICTNTQADEEQKESSVQFLQAHRALGFAENKEAIKQFHDILRRKQLQQTAMKGEVYGDIRKNIAEKISTFENMHAELFAREIAHTVQNVHQNTLLLYDVLVRQEKLLGAMTSETFADLVPHVLFLYEKERNLNGQIEKRITILHKNTLKLVEHISSNYFGRLAKLAQTKEFQEDHHDLFIGAYYLSILTRVVTKAQGTNTQELLEKENQFLKNIT